MNYYVLVTVLLSAIVAFTAVKWVYFKVLKIAKEKNLVDNPDARKLQKSPVPVVGGLAVFFGVVFGLLMGIVIYYAFNQDVTGSATLFTSTRLLPVVLGMVIMLYVGTLDDILGLTPKSRFIIEILVVLGLIFASGSCIDSLHGLWGVYQFSWWIAVPLTVFAGVGIINAINMVDGVNGLSSGLCVTCSLLFGLAFLNAKDVTNAILAFSMSAALLPFFVHNVFGKSSRMFIGDAGTMVMGVLMTWFVICTMHDGGYIYATSGNYCMTAFVLAFLAVPVADTLRVMTMRMMQGKSPFEPDKTHLHHAFVGLGISHSITALTEIFINLLVVGVWYLLVLLGMSVECQLYVVILVAAVLVWGTYFFLLHEQKSASRKAQWLRRFSVKTHLGSTEWWQRLSLWLDAPEYDEVELRNLRERLKRKFTNN
ncbi:MAG: undecaprenyl/decaprenyl-phosphate alpha-N-acetylglucosaminyl 1-phosphate transferase [Bacteroidaceae bacterium]|nr:undecaprenyl/decaprenyl-phosphate alpha-N-acetylglucosaminyl 1-phosphate transferase [Bacteroidaceae bacterium]